MQQNAGTTICPANYRPFRLRKASYSSCVMSCGETASRIQGRRGDFSTFLLRAGRRMRCANTRSGLRLRVDRPRSMGRSIIVLTWHCSVDPFQADLRCRLKIWPLGMTSPSPELATSACGLGRVNISEWRQRFAQLAAPTWRLREILEICRRGRGSLWTGSRRTQRSFTQEFFEPRNGRGTAAIDT